MIPFSSFRYSLAGLSLGLAYCFLLTPVRAQEVKSTDFLLPEMEVVFSETRGMIDHTMTVHGYAMEIQAVEGGDAFVVGASAILHDIGIPRAREVHGSSSGQYQEIEGPPIAREILVKYDVPPAQVDHICGIVANHHSDADPQIVETLEFKILWDADWLVNFPGRHRESTPKEKEEAIENIFKTAKGKLLARQMFLE
jgi:hypothetical protein